MKMWVPMGRADRRRAVGTGGIAMRKLMFGLLLGLAPLPAAAGAQTPEATQPLAANEVLLETSAYGSVRTRADRVKLTAYVTSSGASDGEAFSANMEQVRRVTSAARAIGLAADEI